ncbi:hypothetical protein [Clostridium tyrobutyricum]|uniref:hypothetical protein n=1 Tax=Clostridium tyrobutyricum TaxID=1519 RepID=UPI00057C7A66|nr:hypothetical protein [Clostridium tyrobutyricum]
MKHRTKFIIVGLFSAGVLAHTIGNVIRKKNESKNMIVLPHKNLIIDDELKYLVSEGKKNQAVKRVKNYLGLSLKEAKKYIDNLDV